MACCCEREIVDTYSPAPSDVIRNSIEQANSSSTLPRNGTRKSKIAAVAAVAIFTMPTNANGSVLPSISSSGLDGRDHQLFHGADLFFPHDRHGGEHERHLHQDVHYDAGDEIVAAFAAPD